MTNRKLAKLLCQVFVLWLTTTPEWTLKIYADTANGQCNPLFFLLKMLSPKRWKVAHADWVEGVGITYPRMSCWKLGSKVIGSVGYNPNANTPH